MFVINLTFVTYLVLLSQLSSEIYIEDESNIFAPYYFENSLSDDRSVCTSDNYNRTCCERNEFQCLRGQCISYKGLCDAAIDGKTIYTEDGSKNLKAENFNRLDMGIDCSEGSDEIGCANTNCSSRKNKCHQFCLDLPANKSKCSCYKGYVMKSIDNKEKCIDIDECKLALHLCTHDCINLNGTYTCTCNSKFKLNETECKSIDRDIFVFFNSNNYLFYYNVKNHTIYKYKKTFLSSIDYNPLTNVIYWADKQTIWFDNRMDNGRNDFTMSTILWRETITESFSIDWITNNVYWLNKDVTNYYKIMVSRTSGQNIKTLLVEFDKERNKLRQTTNLVLDPENGWMYWISNYDKFGEISKAKMNGDNRGLVHRFWNHFPVSIALDHVRNRKIFWVDLLSNNIYSSYTDGTGINKVTTVQSGKSPAHMDVFEDYLYWLTDKTNELVRMDKFGRGKQEGLVVGLVNSTALRVFHKHKIQTAIERDLSACSKCDYLCLTIPYGFECACPDGSNHNFDGHTSRCVGVSIDPTNETKISCDCGRLNCKDNLEKECCDVCEDTGIEPNLKITIRKENETNVDETNTGISINYVLISIVLIATLITTLLCLFSFLKPKNVNRPIRREESVPL